MPDDREKPVEEIAEQARQELDQIQDDFDVRLAELEKRAHTAKRNFERSRERIDEQRADDAKAAKGLGVGLTVAYAIIGAPLAGAGVGWLLDRYAGTSGFMGGLCILGAFAGVYFAVVVANRANS